MNYQEQLLDSRWKEKRNKIINRDKNVCQTCKNLKILKTSKPALLLSKNSDREFRIWDIKDNKNTAAIYAGNSINFNTNRSILGFYLPNNNYNLISGILKHTIEYNAKKKFSGSLDDSDLVEVDLFLYDYYMVNKAIEFLDKNRIETFEWQYIFNLHVHHKYYKTSLMAWEYPDESLVTLCWDCHEELHKNTLIPIFSEDEVEGYLTPCYRCYGAGEFPEFNHIQSGICFRCNGERYEELINNIK